MSLDILGQSRFVRFAGDADEVTKGYVRISMKNLFPGSKLSYDVHFPVVGPSGQVVMRKLLGKGQSYESEMRKTLEGKGFEYFYVQQIQLGAFDDYLMSNTKTLISSPHMSVSEKAALLYGNAEYIVEKAFGRGPLEEVIPQGAAFAKVAAKQFSQHHMASGELLKIFAKDYGTFTHSIQVCLLGMAFCIHLGYSEKETEEFGLGALFHDIGKSEIEDSILNKPGKLTAEEFAEIKKHPLFGYEKLLSLNLVTPDQLAIVLHHHEDMNGRGYPDKQQGADIHKYARIVRIIDTYDALTTRRSYKNAFTPGEAFYVMEEEMKPALDEYILKRFWDFMKIEEHPMSSDQGISLSIEIGNQVQLQFTGKSEHLNAMFIGMEPGNYLIIHFPHLVEFKEQISKGAMVVLRYICAGTVYGFEAKIIAHTAHPSRLLFLSYPEKITSCEIRAHARYDCFLFTRAVVSSGTYQGVMINLSFGGGLLVTDQMNDAQAAKVKLNDSIALNFPIFEGQAVKDLPGEVRNVRQSDNRVEIGVRFLSLSDDTKKLLAECIKNLAMASRSF